MRSLLLILVFAVSVSAQDIKELEKIKDWQKIKEMSGEIPNHPGITIEVYAAQIARNEGVIKLWMKTEFPQGSPRLMGSTYPDGFDPSSVSRVVFGLEFDCDKRSVKPIKNSAHVYLFSGARHKSKEHPFTLNAGHILFGYFCEKGETPLSAPALKPKP